MYGINYLYYNNPQENIEQRCKWGFVPSIDCSGNISIPRIHNYTTGSGWINSTSPSLYNPIPCQYKLQISGVLDNFNYPCTYINGDYYLSITNDDSDNKGYKLIGRANLCTTNTMYDNSAFYIESTVNGGYSRYFPLYIGAHFFIGGPDYSNPSVIPSNTYPTLWIRLDYQTDDNDIDNTDRFSYGTIYHNTNIEYSGTYYINSLVDSKGFNYPDSGLYNNVDTACGTVKLNHGNINLLNKTFSFDSSNSTYIGSGCQTCILDSGISYTLSPITDSTNQLYNGQYDSFISDVNDVNNSTSSGNFFDSYFSPQIIKVTLSGILSEADWLAPSSYKYSTCNGNILNNTFYLKLIDINIDNEPVTTYNRYLFENEAYLCCECADSGAFLPSHCINAIELKTYELNNPGSGLIEVNLKGTNLGNTVVSFRKDTVSGVPLAEGIYDLPLRYVATDFRNKISFVSGHCSVEFIKPVTVPCLGNNLQNDNCYKGDWDSFEVTIPNPYSSINNCVYGYGNNPNIAGQTFILSRSNNTTAKYTSPTISGYYFNISLYKDTVFSSGNSYLFLLIEEIQGAGRFTTLYGGEDIEDFECLGVDCSQIIGKTLTPAIWSNYLSNINEYTYQNKSYSSVCGYLFGSSFIVLTSGSALSSVTIS